MYMCYKGKAREASVQESLYIYICRYLAGIDSIGYALRTADRVYAANAPNRSGGQEGQEGGRGAPVGWAVTEVTASVATSVTKIVSRMERPGLRRGFLDLRGAIDDLHGHGIALRRPEVSAMCLVWPQVDPATWSVRAHALGGGAVAPSAQLVWPSLANNCRERYSSHGVYWSNGGRIDGRSRQQMLLDQVESVTQNLHMISRSLRRECSAGAARKLCTDGCVGDS